MARITINGDKLYSTSTGEDVLGTVQGSTRLDQLIDVDMNPTINDGDYLRYNASTSKWENLIIDEIDGGSY